MEGYYKMNIVMSCRYSLFVPFVPFVHFLVPFLSILTFPDEVFRNAVVDCEAAIVGRPDETRELWGGNV